jgi:hypothetical protein
VNIFDWFGEIVRTTRGHIFAAYVLGMIVGVTASMIDRIW